ncbi:MAG: DUF4173 domain-containing protein [Ferruginibacter sp.]|nr:DUF4173 domain-containing protein [Ferruginibacter sp.]
MNTHKLKILLLFAGAVLFNIIFWQEKLAINAILFDVFILLSVFNLYTAAFTKPAMKWLVLAHLVTIATLILHNTILAKLAFAATLLLVVVFTQFLHRSVWYAAASAAGNYLLIVFSFMEDIGQIRRGDIKYLGIGKVLRFLIIPLMIAGIFFLIYRFSNTVFQDVVSSIGIALQRFIARFFDWFNWQRFWFLMLGLFVTGGLILKMRSNYFSEKEFSMHNDLWRRKHNLKKWKEGVMYDVLTLFMGRFANGIMALRNENTVGIISLVMLNVLLLFINVIDITYVWFGFSYTANLNLTQYLHEGTGMLIFSIILAMLVLLFFFRNNLNFYKKNKWLRYGAYGWILQNSVLVISVLLRDYYYITHMGLAYKRIGVLVFLLMVLMGLITVFIKIHQRKTAYYLWRVNGWFGVILLVAASCIHWDETIARYNLAHKSNIPVDVKFLLTLSDKTLPLLDKNQDVLVRTKELIQGEGEYLYRSGLTPKEMFEIRKREFFEKQRTYSWLSWNYADRYVKQNLTKSGLTASLNK